MEDDGFKHTVDLNYGWFDCTCEVECLCGLKLILSSDDEPKTCDICGRTYRLRSFVEVKETSDDSSRE